jgi:hypothetical protein
MNVEAMVWTWIYTGMAVGVISILILLWAIFFENKE